MSSKQRFGLFLIIIGALLAATQFFPRFEELLQKLIAWPLVLILLGLYLLFSKKNRNLNCTP